MKIPNKKPLKKDEIIKILQEEIIRKDKEIERLETENKLLLNVTYKNAKRRAEETETDDESDNKNYKVRE